MGLCAVVLAVGAYAQDNIMFKAGRATNADALSQGAVELLQSKVGQILNRNSAASAGDHGVFVVVPTLNVGDAKTTSGLVQNINVTSGELVLTAKNELDNTEFYSVTVPLKSTGKNLNAPADELLVKSIKITEPVYVRFVRTARQNISDYYENHCEEALERAQTLFTAGETADAKSLLFAVPASAPCAGDAREMIGAIRIAEMQNYVAEHEEELNEKVKEYITVEKPVVVHDTVVVENTVVVEKPVIVEKPVPQRPVKNDRQPKIYISTEGWEIKVLNCEYLPAQRQIKLEVRILSPNESRGELHTVFDGAISGDGETYTSWGNAGDKYYYEYPDGLPVKVGFLIKGVNRNPGSLGMAKFRIGNTKVEIRNLEVK